MWACPWCGEEPEHLNEEFDHSRDVRWYDQWLEAHVEECEPYQKEQGDGN